MTIYKELNRIQQTLKAPKGQRNTFGNYNYRSCEDIVEAVKVIDYCPDTGKITRNDRKNSNGSIDSYGYLIIKIKGLQWKAHRLAWAKYYGVPPVHNIDHIDGNKLNNKITNLRDVRQKDNVLNTSREANSVTGVIGVHKDETTNGLIAKFATKVNGKTYRFRELCDAVKFRKERGLRV